MEILIVENDGATADMLRTLFEMEGYTAQVLVSGKCVLPRLEKSHPDLILLDVLLAADDGRAIAKEIKAQSTTSHIPIVMVSASGRLEETARAAGANTFLRKPFDIDTLLQTVRSEIQISEHPAPGGDHDN